MTQGMHTVAIIGGGFTGASVAYHLARNLEPGADVRVVVIEPRPILGQGLAYSTADPSHRINVPASRMTMDCAIEDGFQRWLDQKGILLAPGARMADGSTYPQRGLVAEYVADNLQPMINEGRIRHLRARAVQVEKGKTFKITLDDGSTVESGQLVIATSHPPPTIPEAFAHLHMSPRLLSDPSDPDRLAKVAQQAQRVAIIGTGLTSADVIASLDRQGFKGKILAISRRGLRSRGHAFGYVESSADFATNPEPTALGVLRRVRAAVRHDATLGLPWQAALDRVRKQGGAIWAGLPLSERRRLLQRLRVWWDVHRFRIAPPVEAVLDHLQDSGRLKFAAGHLKSATALPEGIQIEWRPKGAVLRQDLFDAVILTTGPAHDAILSSSGLLGELARQGLVRADPLRLGLDVSKDCLAINSHGKSVPGLYIAGPLARGRFGELMGIPEVTANAELVAGLLTQQLNKVTESTL